MASPAEEHLDPIGEDDEDALELNEEDLFDEGPSSRGMRHSPMSSAPVAVSDDEEDSPSPSAAAMDLGSGKSSTLALEDSSNMLSPTQGGASGNAIQSRAVPGWSMPQRQLPTPRAITQSLPAHHSNIRMVRVAPCQTPAGRGSFTRHAEIDCWLTTMLVITALTVCLLLTHIHA